MKLHIDDIIYTCDASQKVSLDYRAADLAEVGSWREGSSLRLRLPSTAETDAIFGGPARMDTIDRFNDAYHEARITADGAEIFRGTALLAGVDVVDGRACYELEITGGGAMWAKVAYLRMFNLTDIEYSGLMTPTEICNSWTDDTPVRFLPVLRDNYELHNSSVSSMTPERILTTDDYHPFISVDALVRAIFRQAGYEVDSRFMEGELFRSLYMSGAYHSIDASLRKSRMDFLAGRTADATATADSLGRVYASPSVLLNSVGNIVDTADAALVAGTFSNNGCFSVEEGVARFTPVTACNVGFEYTLHFITDHVIESRERLRGFDRIYLGSGVTVPFTIANRYTDHRSDLTPDFSYSLVIFDYSDKYVYRLMVTADGQQELMADVAGRVSQVSTPRAGTVTNPLLFRAEAGSTLYEYYSGDWALYNGFVGEKGQTEIEIVVRTPPEELTPASPKYFNEIYFDRADPGMSFTLCRETAVRPLFSSAVGYGSQIEFSDIAQHSVRQAVLIEALVQMFNLRIYTDERRKRVLIEPYDDFFIRSEVYDWSDRIDMSADMRIEETACSDHESRTWCYLDGDEAVSEFEADLDAPFASWSFDMTSRATIQGDDKSVNPLFAPTVNVAGEYANAESALIMRVGDAGADTADETANFSPRIVRYAGLHPLHDGERWGYPFNRDEYPLAAFHFAGDADSAAFTLCFEDRDGAAGLHSFYDRELADRNRGNRVKLRMRLSPADYEGLFAFIEGVPSIRSVFRLRYGDRLALFILEAVEDYDPSEATAMCTFLQIGDK